MTDASTYFPGQLYQNPDGSFSLNITGHLHAAGLDLDASSSNTPPNTDRIRWIRQSDGSVIANIYGYSQAGAEDAALLSAQAAAAGNTSKVILDATDDAGLPGNAASIVLQQVARGVPPTSTAAFAIALAHQATLIDGAGQSSFLQLPSVQPSMIWFGAVNGTGGVRLHGSGTTGPGATWSVTRTAVGTYTLTLAGGINGVWAIPLVQCNESSGAIAEVDYVSQAGTTTTITVKTVSGPFSFGLADINWSFVATASKN